MVVNDEDEKLDVLKQISNLKIKLDGISENTFHDTPIYILEFSKKNFFI